MSRDVIGISPDAPIREAFDLLRAHHIEALPVTSDDARVIGIVTQTDLLDKAAWSPKGLRLGWRRQLDLTFSRGRAPNGSIAEIMTVPVRTTQPDALLANVVRQMAAGGLHHMPVVEPDGRLAGIVSQSDLTVALLAEQAETRKPPQPIEKFDRKRNRRRLTRAGVSLLLSPKMRIARQRVPGGSTIRTVSPLQTRTLRPTAVQDQSGGAPASDSPTANAPS